jgi:hypothetical protein
MNKLLKEQFLAFIEIVALAGLVGAAVVAILAFTGRV